MTSPTATLKRQRGESFFAEILALVLLVFLFYGDPDPWDKLHDAVIKMDFQQECKK